MKKVKLNVLGLSYSQMQSGAYALVLTEENGKQRLPIIIGGFEAQAIAIELEGLKPPRPLTHDLFVNFALAYKIELIEVVIYKLEEGIFYAELVCDNGGSRIKIDARTSDAVALALRFKCPIYTTQEIISKAGIILKFKDDDSNIEKKSSKEEVAKPKIKQVEFFKIPLEELKKMLKSTIQEEDYEKASKIRDEIVRRKNKQQ
ncbi:MAG: bifunctional nuclease family protein [Bacteroidetes bacterium]|nr:bifunctional nuclease family protein [Bacteroidota bacterium]